MSRYNPVELIWDAMLRAAALGASENDDPGLIDIIDKIRSPWHVASVCYRFQKHTTL